MPEVKEKNKYAITTRTGEVITLDRDTVKKYLTENTDISESEFAFFFQLCKVNKVNPFLKEAYIIKYGDTPATIVLDYKVLQQIAEENKCYRGMKHGVIVKSNGNVIERHGEYCLPNEELIAGWCEVYRSDRDEPTKVVAMFNEFKGAKKNGELNSNWLTKPCFMITKVAKAQALREAFPNLVGSNVYTTEEMDSVKNANEPAGKTTITNRLADDDGVIEAEPTNESSNVADTDTSNAPAE